MNYYNENNPEAVYWLRELIRAGEIPPGDIDDRSIEEVKPHEIANYTQHHFFAGIGGWALALRLAGWPDDQPVRTASCPCQPFSQTGKQLGFADKRHLWPVLFRLIEADGGRIAITFGEQVASPLGREWLAGVRTDLESLAHEVGAADLCAAGVGSPHIRQRLYWVAFAAGKQRIQRGGIVGGESRAADSNVAIAGSIGGVVNSNCGRLENEDQQFINGGETTGERETIISGTGISSVRVVQSDSAGRDAGRTAGAAAGHGNPIESAGGINRVEHSTIDGREQRGAESGERGVISGCGQDFNRVGNADGAGSQGRDERIFRCDYQWPVGSPNLVVLCEDGKARRFEPGSFPLAHGIPGRVGLLRGYGNAIVPQLAAEFIGAAREAIGNAGLVEST